jgi:hypothetical protein
MIRSIARSFLVLFVASSAFSEVTPAVDVKGETNTQISDIVGNKKFEENTDITDAKIKADSGSLSKYSLRFSLSYYGPTLGDLSSKDQPNPDGSVGSYATAIGGSFGGRYRIDKKTTISLGTGIKLIHPFHGMDRTDMNNPYMSYDMTSKVSDVQMRNSFGVSYITVPNYKEVGEYGSLSYDLSLSYDIGLSDFAISLDSSVGYYLYDRDYKPSDRNANRASVSFYPGLKYRFSDKFSLNTSTNISFWNPRWKNDEFALLRKTVTQRLGLGYAFSRDIYISPYIDFYPDRITADGTTLNISSSFSLL